MRQKRTWLLLYLALLALSHLVRLGANEGRLPEGATRVTLPAVGGDQKVELVYRDLRGADATSVVVLLHGSPGGIQDFRYLAPALAARHRVIIPDLPGFGASSRRIPDYSISAHADYLIALLDHLDIDRAHLVGFSMGGGPALWVAERAPERVDSLVLLSSIGVQEFELLGDRDLNRLVHGAQWAGIFALTQATPHFGWLDRFPINLAYARNFYDSDQRPLRGIIEGLEVPTLIVHGTRDALVPYPAALEHHRLVPQAELLDFPEGHFVLWERRDEIANTVGDFFHRVDRGLGTRRGDAETSRLTDASRPFAPEASGPIGPVAWTAFFVLVALATLVSEDLTCIGVGFLIARGQVPLEAGVVACALGLWIGDLLLYAAGRGIARSAGSTALVRWFGFARVERARQRFGQSGASLIFASRFLPGARLPIYLGAGLARYPAARFALLMALAVAIWTPLLVGAAQWLGAGALEHLDAFRHATAMALGLTLLAVIVLSRVIVPLLTHRGRRRFYARQKRFRHFEFWPLWFFYLPLVPALAWLGVRHGGLRTATAANPAIPAGGLAGESKWDILQGLAGAGDAIARTERLPIALDRDKRLRRARDFMERHQLTLPVVIKPDVGERGMGVEIPKSNAALTAAVEARDHDVLIQEYIPGVEFGVFYVREPDAARGEIISITEKKMIAVCGNGVDPLERLILDDPRAVCLADVHFERHADRLQEIPKAGEEVPLTELGTHCRGALFLDGARLASDALSNAIDAISQHFRGFFFGRYDLRCASEHALQSGRQLKIIELNGLSSESTHIYDPKHSLSNAYRTLYRQWRIAFEIGASNRELGSTTPSWRQIAALLRHEAPPRV